MLTDHKLSNVEASGDNWANVVPVHLISDATSADGCSRLCPKSLLSTCLLARKMHDFVQ